ncbi:MAG: aminotransferase class IV [Proteobacteria bacterium]|nr:aminotransferase class IV [Pseudomonadota bacterium]
MPTALAQPPRSPSDDLPWRAPGDSPAWLNGRFMTLGEARVPVLDRGFLFGDAVYEVVPIFNGHLFRWALHRARLVRSLAGFLFGANDVDVQAIEQAALALAAKCGGAHACLYLQISRGSYDKRDHNIPQLVVPTVVMWLSPWTRPARRPKGLRLATVADIRWQMCHLKSTALAGNILARHQARVQGYDDALLIRDGRAVEATAANLLLVSAGEVLIPDADQEMLPGITRTVVTELAARVGVQCTTVSPPLLDMVLSANEVWLCSSTKLILPVAFINDHPLADHQHSGIGSRLLEAFFDMVDGYDADEDAA